MKANRAFELIVSRDGIGPAFLADGDRSDRVEIVSIDDGEVVLFWDLAAKDAGKMARDMRTDLASMDSIDFIAKWSVIREESE
jgi:hypothetical protein